MSRDKRQKPAEGADPGSQQTPDQQGEPEAGKTGPTARLGKEAKIGAAVILVLVAALAVVAILRFTGRHSAGPVAAAAAKGKAKAGNANPNHSSNLDRGASRPADRAGATVAPAAAAHSALPYGTAASSPPWEGSGTGTRDADPMSSGGFPALAAPVSPRPTVIQRHRTEGSQPRERRELTRQDAPSLDDPFHRRPARPASPPIGAGSVPAASSHTSPPRDPIPGSRFPAPHLGLAPPPPPDRDDIPAARGSHASTSHEHSAPTLHRERGRYDDLELEPGEPMAGPSYREPPPPREPSYRASAAGMRREYRAGRAYTVAEGETLFTIARYELGNASRWVEIYELNRDALDKGLNDLRPGTKLLLPANERPDVLAEPSGNVYRR